MLKSMDTVENLTMPTHVIIDVNIHIFTESVALWEAGSSVLNQIKGFERSKRS